MTELADVPNVIGNSARFAAAPWPAAARRRGTGWPATGFRHSISPTAPALVMVAPHPDDETLGLGATAAQLAAAGVDVQVVAVSDGGGDDPELSAYERILLERTRTDRIDRAPAGFWGCGNRSACGLPDGADLASTRSGLADLLTEILDGRGPNVWCATTWRGDGHPDHEAVGRAAAVAAARTGAELLEYPVWMWHWATSRRSRGAVGPGRLGAR